MSEPIVKITCPDGTAMSARVTVDDTVIPCTKIVWTITADGYTEATLTVPFAALDVEVVAGRVNVLIDGSDF